MMIVPDKTIAFIDTSEFKNINIESFLKPLSKTHKRDWFSPHFYRCLPLSIGNMQGFSFSMPYNVNLFWNGGSEKKDLAISPYGENITDIIKNTGISIDSYFGHGIFTVHFPFILKTPPGVNLMTISPPNFPVSGFSPMTGVVETDNLKFTFTLNFKINHPNTLIKILKDEPIMGILPIPRYFCDSFNLVNAYDIIDHKLIEEELEIAIEQSIRREEQNSQMPPKVELLYFKGMDIRKNKFKDHQVPGKEK
jgi:hypothetical protein